VLTLDHINSAMAANSPSSLPVEGRSRAAVALLLREGTAAVSGVSSLEVLFIERAQKTGDPWSGHIAFPGGRMDPGDASDRYTAERETQEEVGLVLDAARHLGRLDDISGRAAAARQMVVSAHVYHLPDPGPVVPNHEVATAFWFPLMDLLDASRQVKYTVPIGGREIDFPGIALEDPERHILWGMTYRFIEIFLSQLDYSLPALVPNP
jgi:8-oxo-dGTP pyrophosphatase MutT (NUDIX family)